MKKLLILAALVGVMAAPAAVPAFAQQHLTPMQTNSNPADGRLEMRNARGADLIAVTPEQAKANMLKRCDPLPAYYKSDCIARINGQGMQAGSVLGGGVILESKTTMPATQLQQEQADIGQPNLHGLKN